jgi:hypothetical protein
MMIQAKILFRSGTIAGLGCAIGLLVLASAGHAFARTADAVTAKSVVQLASVD